MHEPGWLDRQCKAIEEESKSWPDWMKRAAGIKERAVAKDSTMQSPDDPDLNFAANLRRAADDPDSWDVPGLMKDAADWIDRIEAEARTPWVMGGPADYSADEPIVMAAAERVVRAIRDLRIRNNLWAEEGSDAQVPADVLSNPDVTAYDRLNGVALAEPMRGSALHRLVAAIIAEEMTRP